MAILFSRGYFNQSGSRKWLLARPPHRRASLARTTAAAMKPVDMYLGEHYATTLLKHHVRGALFLEHHVRGPLLCTSPFSLAHFFWIPCDQSSTTWPAPPDGLRFSISP